MKLSIIIPVYNEEQTIVELLSKVIKVKLPKSIKKEIIVVDDGSTDSSKLKIQNLKLPGIKLISSQGNEGKGAAIKIGLNCATGDLIIIQDGDLEYDPIYYSKLLEPILTKKAKIVYGSRLTNYPLRFWGKNKTVLPMNLIANRVLALLTNLLYGSNITDMETCYKLFTGEILRRISIKSKRFDFEPEITAKLLKKGFKIYEVPVTSTPRTYKEGKKIGWKDGLTAIYTLIKYRLVD